MSSGDDEAAINHATRVFDPADRKTGAVGLPTERRESDKKNVYILVITKELC